MKKEFLPIVLYSLFILNIYHCGSTVNTVDSSAQQPSWVPSPKPNPMYIYGVGVADFTHDKQTTIDKSRTNAVSDLAYQISSTITSSISDTTIEKNGWIKESFEQFVQLSTKEYIENWEMVDRWENPVNGRVWTWIRLSREQYESQKKEEEKKVISRTLNYLKSFDNAIAHSDPSSALRYLLSGMYTSRFLFSDNVEVEYPKYSGIKVDLNDAIQERSNKFFKNIYIVTTAKPDIIIGGINSGLKLVVKSVYISAAGKEIPFKNIPIQFKIMDQTPVEVNIISDDEGIAVCPFNLTSPFITELEIQVSINVDKIDIDKVNENIKEDIEISRVVKCPIEITRIPVRPPKFFLNSKEKIKGYEVSRDKSFVSTAIQESLADAMNGQFTKLRSDADYVINLTVNSKFSSRERVKSDWLYYYYAETRVSIAKPNDGTELYSFYLEPPPKEYGRNDREAADRTLRKAAVLVKKEITPNIVNYFKMQEHR